MNRNQRRKMDTPAFAQNMVSMALGQFGLSTTAAKLVAAQYRETLQIVADKGVDPKEDAFVSVVVLLDTINEVAPDKIRLMVPYLQGQASLPSFIPQPWNQFLSSGHATMKAMKLLRNRKGEPLLSIHRLSDDEVATIAAENLASDNALED